MAKLTREDVLKLAQLSKLELTEGEISLYQSEIAEILDYVKQLGDVDLSKYEPTNQVTGLVNVTRPDVVKDYGPSKDDLLKNVPEVEDDHIKVKRMLT